MPIGWQSNTMLHWRKWWTESSELGPETYATIPGLTAVCRLVLNPDELPPERLLCTLDRIVCEHRGHCFTKVAVRTAGRLIEQVSNGMAILNRTNPDILLCRHICEDIVQQSFLGKARVHMLVDGIFVDPGETRVWQCDLMRVMHPQLESLSKQLTRDSSAKDLRAPKGLAPKKSTIDLLDEVLL